MFGQLCWDTLNDNAGAITAIATGLMVSVTVIMVMITAGYARTVKKQLEQMKLRDQLHARRAIQSIVTEIEVNAHCAEQLRESPFLLAAYASSLWALSEVEISQETWKAIADAYIFARRFNSLYSHGFGRGTMTTYQTMWANKEQKIIPKALQVIRKDTALQKFLAGNGSGSVI